MESSNEGRGEYARITMASLHEKYREEVEALEAIYPDLLTWCDDYVTTAGSVEEEEEEEEVVEADRPRRPCFSLPICLQEEESRGDQGHSYFLYVDLSHQAQSAALPGGASYDERKMWIEGHGPHASTSTLTALQEVLKQLHADDRCIYSTYTQLCDALRSLEEPTNTAPLPAPSCLHHPQDCLTESPTAANTTLMAIYIDHMRDKKKYCKILQSWTTHLPDIRVLLLHPERSRDDPGLVKGVYLVLQGSEEDVRSYQRLLRTEYVDVNSAGQACKERQAYDIVLLPPCAVTSDHEKTKDTAQRWTQIFYVDQHKSLADTIRSWHPLSCVDRTVVDDFIAAVIGYQHPHKHSTSKKHSKASK